jgi:ABC-type dipeptide/oligopeptide/nickel transport system permease component
VFLLLLPLSEAFSGINLKCRQSVALQAKKKGTGKAKGFGKAVEAPQKSSSFKQNANQVGGGFSSIEDASVESFSRPTIELDPNLSTDERNKEILKQQFGLRSYEDQQGDIRAAAKAAENQKRVKQIKQMKDEDFDIFMVIPAPLIKVIDAFLKIGLTVSTGLFILAGAGICAEAWTVATGNTIPDNVDQFIVSVVEPNFTNGLLVLLGFSVSLGIFASAQLGSGSSTYKEEP